jgi:hypothetical protein
MNYVVLYQSVMSELYLVHIYRLLLGKVNFPVFEDEKELRGSIVHGEKEDFTTVLWKVRSRFCVNYLSFFKMIFRN